MWLLNNYKWLSFKKGEWKQYVLVQKIEVIIAIFFVFSLIFFNINIYEKIVVTSPANPTGL